MELPWGEGRQALEGGSKLGRLDSYSTQGGSPAFGCQKRIQLRKPLAMVVDGELAEGMSPYPPKPTQNLHVTGGWVGRLTEVPSLAFLTALLM